MMIPWTNAMSLANESYLGLLHEDADLAAGQRLQRAPQLRVLDARGFSDLLEALRRRVVEQRQHNCLQAQQSMRHTRGDTNEAAAGYLARMDQPASTVYGSSL